MERFLKALLSTALISLSLGFVILLLWSFVGYINALLTAAQFHVPGYADREFAVIIIVTMLVTTMLAKPREKRHVRRKK